MKHSNRSRDLPACSAVPHPTALSRAADYSWDPVEIHRPMGTSRCYLLQQNAGLSGRTLSTRTYCTAGEEDEEPKQKTFKVSCVFDKNRLKGGDTFVARLKTDIQLSAMWNCSSYRTENTVRLLQQPGALSCSF
jgi:hypothetical protein